MSRETYRIFFTCMDAEFREATDLKLARNWVTLPLLKSIQGNVILYCKSEYSPFIFKSRLLLHRKPRESVSWGKNLFHKERALASDQSALIHRRLLVITERQQ
jgi:hypothetical protein